jgi:ligand-binding sensor domain-containing protein
LSHLVLQYFFILLAGAHLSIKTHAQLPDYHVRLFDESHGFSSYAPYQIIQDQQDFIWILYADRIQRFNGKQVKEFLPGDRLARMLCDRENRIWVAGVNNMYLFSNDHQGFKKLAFDSTGGLLIGHVFQLPGKPIWLHTSKGFFELDEATLKFNKINWPELQVKPPLNFRHFSIFENTFFFSNNDSVFVFDVDSRSRISLKGKNTNEYYGLNSRLLLLTTWDHLSYWFDFANKRITPVVLSEGPLSGKDESNAHRFFLVTGLEKINEKEYILTSTAGVFKFDINTGSFRKLALYSKGKALESGRSINTLYFDRHQNMWMFYDNGLISFKPNQETIGLIRNFETDPGKAWNDNVRNFIPDEKENLWLVTAQGFAYWDLTRNIFTSYAPKLGATDQLNHPSVRGLYYDGKYVILGPTNGGIWLFNPTTKKYRKPIYERGSKGDTTRRRLENDFIKHIKLLHSGNYIISARDGVYIMDAKTFTIRPYLLFGRNENTLFAYQDSRKRIWMGTDVALHCLDSQLVHLFRIPPPPGFRNFYSICELKPDEYLAAGYKGLFHIILSNDEPIVKKVDPLFDNMIISAIIKDKTQKFWLSTLNHYLYNYDPVKNKIDSFDLTDNLQGNEYNINGFYLSPGGMLFLGGTNGINYFYPDKIGRKKDSLRVSITKITVNQDDTGYYHRNGTIFLEHSQNSIELTYISPYYSNAEQIHYRYRLQGIDTGWRNNGNNNTIRFSSLSPGKYVFHVAASINRTDWFESSDKPSFIITPPFWQTGWFRLLVAGSVFLLIALFYRLRMNYMRQQQAEKIEKLKTKQADAERELQLSNLNHDLATSRLTALRAQMNPHFIFNALNSVQQYMLQGNAVEANKYLSKFSKLQREILNHSDQDFILLEKELEMLNLYLLLEQLRFDDTFRYSITVDEAIDPDEIKIPPMLVQPFVENAIWHGLMPKPGERKVDIHFALSDDQFLICSIKDNGIGREAANRLRQATGNGAKHVSKGLSLVYERLKILRQQYNHAFELNVTDILNKEGVSEGTLVTLTLFAGD